MKTAIVDANVILGYLVRKEGIFERTISEYDELIVPEQVVFEVVYVLEKQYDLTRDVIVKVIIKILQEKKIQCSRLVLINSLLIYQDNRQLSLVDCYLLVLAEDTGANLVTGDKQILKGIKQ